MINNHIKHCPKSLKETQNKPEVSLHTQQTSKDDKNWKQFMLKGPGEYEHNNIGRAVHWDSHFERQFGIEVS